ncbi:CBM43-containing protein [Zostera marina]|uniref:CBM43-containing protein n=1 Tax=Zostera marina TaxID=29655 RepID=A0A0K9NQX7_ZOSMR|nr:CBM43-containing protein [Zostera marina]
MVVHAKEKTWCVAKPSSNDATLLENINYACSIVDCGILKHGGACFYPNNLISHASVAMNLYYQSNGKNPWNCYFKASGLVTKINPSVGNCYYA